MSRTIKFVYHTYGNKLIGEFINGTILGVALAIPVSYFRQKNLSALHFYALLPYVIPCEISQFFLSLTLSLFAEIYCLES